MSIALKDVGLRKKATGELVNGGEALEGKLVALYFSAHWCPPCRNFTPALKTFYDELKESGDEQFELVFVPFDRSAEDVKTYLAESHGDWLYLDYDSEHIRKLADKYGVQGIPALIVIRPDGTVVTKDGRSDVQSKPAKVAFSAWKKAAEAAASAK